MSIPKSKRLEYDMDKLRHTAERYADQNAAHIIFLSRGDQQEFKFGGNAQHVGNALVRMVAKLSVFISRQANGTVPPDHIAEQFVGFVRQEVQKIVEEEQTNPQ